MVRIITKVEEIFVHGNRHMQAKLKYFSPKGQAVIKYIMGRLRKYKGVFFESNKTIAEACDVSVSTVQRIIRRCEQLAIFLVSSRTESTFNDKHRQTTNKIQLLSYVAVKVVKEVTEQVRKTSVKVQEITKKKPNNPYQRATKITKTDANYLPQWAKGGKDKLQPASEESKEELLSFMKEVGVLTV